MSDQGQELGYLTKRKLGDGESLTPIKSSKAVLPSQPRKERCALALTSHATAYTRRRNEPHPNPALLRRVV